MREYLKNSVQVTNTTQMMHLLAYQEFLGAGKSFQNHARDRVLVAWLKSVVVDIMWSHEMNFSVPNMRFND